MSGHRHGSPGLRPLRAQDYQAPDDAARRLAEAAEPRVADHIDTGFDRLRDGIDAAALLALLTAGNYIALYRVLGIVRLDDAMLPAVKQIAELQTEAAEAAMTEAAATEPAAPVIAQPLAVPVLAPLQRPEPAIPLTYDPMAPEALAAQQGARQGLLDTLRQGAERTVQTVLQDGLAARLAPDELARDLRDTLGLSQREAKAVANFRRLLEQGDRAALDRVLRDRRFDASIERAIRGEALDPEKIDRMVARYAERYRAFRARTIARTETLRAANTGRLQAWRQYADRTGRTDGDIVRRWQTAADERVCFPAGTLVATSLGQKPIEHLAPGVLILTRKGERKLVATSVRVTLGPMVVIRTDRDDVLPMTAEHPVMVNEAWLEAGRIVVGDTVEMLGEERAKVSAVAHILLIDADGAPAESGKTAVAARVLGWVSMPVDAVNLNRDAPSGDGEVDRVSPDTEFLHEFDAQEFKDMADRSLRPCLAAEGPIAAERAEPGIKRREAPERFVATLARGHYGRPTTDFGAIGAVQVRLATKPLAASLAEDVFGAGNPACAGATQETALDHGADPEEPIADTARLRNELRLPQGQIAGAGADTPSSGCRLEHAATDPAWDWRSRDTTRVIAVSRTIDLCEAGGPVLGELRTAVAAIVGEDRHSDFCDQLSLLKHTVVYDLQTEQDHEFFANGMLVHNCIICRPIPLMNPNGVPIGQPYATPEGDVDMPPIHPACRCTERFEVGGGAMQSAG